MGKRELDSLISRSTMQCVNDIHPNLTQHSRDVGWFYYNRDERDTLALTFVGATAFNLLGFLVAGAHYWSVAAAPYLLYFIPFGLPFFIRSRKIAKFLGAGGHYVLKEGFIEPSRKLMSQERISFKGKHVKVVGRGDQKYDIFIACSRLLDFLAGFGRKDFSIALYGVTNIDEVLLHLKKYGDVRIEKDLKKIGWRKKGKRGRRD